jgi:hypothetical protein
MNIQRRDDRRVAINARARAFLFLQPDYRYSKTVMRVARAGSRASRDAPRGQPVGTSSTVVQRGPR